MFVLKQLHDNESNCAKTIIFADTIIKASKRNIQIRNGHMRRQGILWGGKGKGSTEIDDFNVSWANWRRATKTHVTTVSA